MIPNPVVLGIRIVNLRNSNLRIFLVQVLKGCCYFENLQLKNMWTLTSSNQQIDFEKYLDHYPM